MKILYSNVIELNAGWGAEYFVNRGFIKLGHNPFSIDFRKYRGLLNSQFLQAPVCDVFLLQRGDDFPIPILKALQIPRIFWASELVSRCRDQDRLLKSGLFSHIFLHTQACVDSIVDRNWTPLEICSVLLNGFDETIFKPSQGINKDVDVLFVGTLTPRREKWIEQISQSYAVRIISAFGDEMAAWVNRSKIILNLHAEGYADTETRVFEVLGSGGFLLTEKLSPENPFSEDELVQFETVGDCVDKIYHYLRNQDEREIIAQNGYRTAIQKHTYTERAQEIVDVMSPLVQIGNEPKKNLDRTLLRYYDLEETVRQNIITPGLMFPRRLVQKAKSILKGM